MEIIILTAQCIVAHPDDCIIFARPFIETFSNFKWNIIYLTYCSEHDRAVEVTNYWSSYNISTTFLGFDDHWPSVEQGLLGFDSAEASTALLKNINSDLILTHSSNGEYQHPHHIFVHQTLSQSLCPKVYFAGVENFNFSCSADTALDLDKLPLHRAVIQSFESIDQGHYLVTNLAMPLIKQ